jgi:single-stranded-DNA-specific exonuclease
MSTKPLIDTRPVWIEPEHIPKSARWNGLDPHPLVSAILYRRGLREPSAAHAFMHPGQQPLPDHHRIPNMDAAVRRILRAIAHRETVAVFGDYDADGVTSTAILASALRASLPVENVITRLPTRAEGYGLNRSAIAGFKTAGASLVIATDCASSDHINAAHVIDEGMDLIIVDHHHMTDPGPENAITISPQLGPDSALQDLTAAGVAYLLVAAIAAAGQDVSTTFGTDPTSYLDLAAIGTIADVAPIDGINRPLVVRGIEAMRKGARPGLNALLAESSLERQHVTAENVSFQLAPRLNAPGRLETPDLALELLLAPDLATARPLAREVEDLNRRRKARGAEILAEAWSAFCQYPGWEDRPVVAVQSHRWEPGLIGAVASRLVEEVRRPVFLFHERDGVLSGSARSVTGFNLMTALEAGSPILTRFGGHSLAAGLALESQHLTDLETYLAAAIREQGVSIPIPHQLTIDAVLPPDYMTIGTPRELARMEPFGRGNERPLLLVRQAELLRYAAFGGDQRHLRIHARSSGRQFEAIFWGAAWRSGELVGTRNVDLVGRLDINHWNGNERLQMIVEDVRPT